MIMTIEKEGVNNTEKKLVEPINKIG